MMEERELMRYIHIITISLFLSCFCHVASAEETSKKDRFQKIGEAIVLDTQTELMWASQDNGKDIDWNDAESYCEKFEAGGYTDWRLPELKELATLYTKDIKNKDGYYIINFITLTDCCPWSSDTSMGGASTFSYNTGKEPFASLEEAYQARALPVRNIEKVEPHGKMVKRDTGVN